MIIEPLKSRVETVNNEETVMVKEENVQECDEKSSSKIVLEN